jgi:hypothetical protein
VAGGGRDSDLILIFHWLAEKPGGVAPMIVSGKQRLWGEGNS